MSPEICIEPCGLVVAELALELVADVVLAQRPNGESDGIADRRVELSREALEFVVGGDIDPDARALHANQHTPRMGRRDSRALGWIAMHVIDTHACCELARVDHERQTLTVGSSVDESARLDGVNEFENTDRHAVRRSDRGPV
jgi:hypothetical protein